MADNKKSFILYCDVLHSVTHLTDKQAGLLFKHILNYVNDKNPETNDTIINLAFEPIKQQLKRDLKKWVGERKQRSAAGKKGMLKRWGKNKGEKITKHNSVIPPITNITDNVTVTVNVNDTVIHDIEIETTIQFCGITLNRNYDKKGISELWQAFLINGQKENYTTREKKIQHFRNWIKTQPNLNGTHQQSNRQGIKAGSKSAGAHKLVDHMRDEYNAERSG